MGSVKNQGKNPYIRFYAVYRLLIPSYRFSFAPVSVDFSAYSDFSYCWNITV